MASAYGVTKEGFRKKRLFDIKIEIEQTLKSILGNGLNLLGTSVFGNLVGTFSERESLLWELAEQVYFSQWLHSAEGVNLDNVVALLFVERLGQRKSFQRNLHLFGVAGTVIPATTKFYVNGSPLSVFETRTEVTLVAGVDEVQTLTFGAVPGLGSFRITYSDQTTGLLNFDADATAIQNALNLLPKLEGITVVGNMADGFTITFAGASGKIDHPLLVVTDNTTTQTTEVVETVAGVPQGVVDAECTSFGPVVAPAFSLTQIVTPIAGLTGATNPTDATVGRFVETDSELRVRAIISQNSRGRATINAITARLLAVDGVTQALVFNNYNNVTDLNGLPRKSFRAYVQGGLNEDIFQAIFDAMPAGIKPDGTIVGTVADSQNITQQVAFERPVVKPVYINVKIYRDITKFPAAGAAAVQDTLFNYVNSLQIGGDLIVYPLLIGSLDTIPGINDVEIGVGFAPNPPLGQDDNLQTAVNEILKVQVKATDIVVTVV